jgi:hypothetical protein
MRLDTTPNAPSARCHPRSASASQRRRARFLHRLGLRAWMTALLLLLGACGQVRAMTLCANSVATLQAAFSVSEIVQQEVTIQIASGSYALPGLNVQFAAPVTLLGGYNGDCTSRPAPVSAANTVLDFGGAGVLLQQLSGSPQSKIVVDGVSFLKAAPFKLYVGNWGEDSAIRLSRTHIGGVPGFGQQSEIWMWGEGTIDLENVLFDRMATQMASDECAFEIQAISGGWISLSSVTADIAWNKKFCLKGSVNGDSAANIHNSILWSSVQTSSVDASFLDTVNVVNSTYFALLRHGANGQTTNVLQVDPLWAAPGNGDYRLLAASPSVNSGTVIVPTGLPATDVEGHARWVGSRPDRGAYESPFDDATNYVVTTVADSGAGSLRSAMEQANSLPNPATITFAIPGACPRVIAPLTALPKVTSPMIIDGTSQPGSTLNDDADAFNANVCVVVKPASGTLPLGFAVPQNADAASLTLRGVAIGAITQPVLLLGGSNHVIAGNRFGGLVGGVQLPGAGLYAVSIGVNAGGSLSVGGVHVDDRNVISGASLGGINVMEGVASSPDNCRIVNNLIGLSPSGNTALPNFTGINLSGSGCSIVGNRIAGNDNDAIWINGGSDNVVQRNIIGVGVNGNTLFSAGAGVRIGSGSGNVVGATAASAVAGTIFSNTIRGMGAGGIVATGGNDNALRTNLVYGNGAQGQGMAIDLGATGADANDAGDLDDGANRMQNFPTIQRIVLAQAGGSLIDVPATVGGQLDAAPGSYRIDAYYSHACTPAVHLSGRGEAEAFIGTRHIDLLAGDATFEMPIVIPELADATYVSLTATDAAGNTSEIGTCFALGHADGDAIFADGVDGPT